MSQSDDPKSNLAIAIGAQKSCPEAWIRRAGNGPELDEYVQLAGRTSSYEDAAQNMLQTEERRWKESNEKEIVLRVVMEQQG